MEDWLVTHLNERERVLYRIAITHSKDAQHTEEVIYHCFVKEAKKVEKKD